MSEFVNIETGEITNSLSEYIDASSLPSDVLKKCLTYSYSSIDHAQNRRKRKWSNRLIMENETSRYTYFCTLTFANEYYCDDYDFLRKSARDFIKRLRRYFDYHFGKKVKLFLACEAGEKNGRWHFHFIIFDATLSVVEFRQLLDKLWKFGRTQALIANTNRLKYVAKYIVKGGRHGLDERYFIIYSRGLGQNWYLLNRFKHFGRYQTFTYIRGCKVKNDSYFRHKFFTKIYNERFYDENFGPLAWSKGKIILPSPCYTRVPIIYSRDVINNNDCYLYGNVLSVFAEYLSQALYDQGHYK